MQSISKLPAQPATHYIWAGLHTLCFSKVYAMAKNANTTQPSVVKATQIVPASQPATSQPATSQPATSQPATSQPATSQPVTSKYGEGKCAICGKPISPNNQTGNGSTCTKHLGRVGKYYQPAPADVATNTAYITLVKLCDASQALGKSRGYAVRLCGGDAGTLPPYNQHFTVYVLGKRKYVKATALQQLANPTAPAKPAK